MLPSCCADLPFFILVRVASKGEAALDARLDDLLFPTCRRGRQESPLALTLMVTQPGCSITRQGSGPPHCSVRAQGRGSLKHGFISGGQPTQPNCRQSFVGSCYDNSTQRSCDCVNSAE